MNKKHLLVVASTFPASKNDPVPSFVKDQLEAMRIADSSLRITVVAPHDKRSGTRDFSRHKHYNEYRFHYMWPRSLEKLSGQGGIIPSLKKHKWLYLVIPFFVLAQFFTVLRLTWKLKPHVINAHWIIPQGFVCTLVGAMTRTKVISTIHGSDVFTFNNAPARAIKKFTLKRSQAVAVNSSATRSRAREILPSKDYRIIPMGVDMSLFKNTGKSATAKSKPMRVLFVGRLSAEKGIAYLLQALASLRDSGHQFNATIAGTGPEEAYLKGLSQELGLDNIVNFVGWVQHEKLPELYKKHDVFVGPSVTLPNGAVEALGLVFIEAAAAGLPVVATRVGGIKDIVKPGETGYLVNEKSSSDIVLALERLENAELRNTMGKAGRNYMKHNFSWSSVAERYIQLVDSALSD